MAKRIAPDEGALDELIGFATGAKKAAKAADAGSRAFDTIPGPGEKTAALIAGGCEDGDLKNGTVLNFKVPPKVRAAMRMAGAMEGMTYAELLEKMLREQYPGAFR